ncbi:unnamed protein product [Allacma fusca]|uniref:Uncharacterized protein n=1 Tax=Allacma fusca TaxID=39272 RepID=A0A8J2JT56_9HEXA|nr:unnamed protein product [Allacma fusca]
MITADWTYKEVLVDIDILDERHNGSYLAKSLVNVLENYSILDKVASSRADNASKCDTLVSEFERSLRAKTISITDVTYGDDLNSGNTEAETEDDHDSNTQYEYDSQDEEKIESDEVISDGSKLSIFSRLRMCISKIRKSLKMRQDFIHACQIEKIKLMWLLLDCPTRWNTSYLMLERVSRYRKPFQVVLRGCKQLNRLMFEVPKRIEIVPDDGFLVRR